jgi:hypothetical protein
LTCQRPTGEGQTPRCESRQRWIAFAAFPHIWFRFGARDVAADHAAKHFGLFPWSRAPGSGHSLMLIVRADQLAVFERLQLDRFVDQTAAHLRQEHQDAVAALPPDRLRDRVALAVARGMAYGMRTEAALQQFVAVMFEFGADFDDHPTVRAILHDPSTPPDYLIEALWQNLPQRVWEELLILADDDDWQDAADSIGDEAATDEVI